MLCAVALALAGCTGNATGSAAPPDAAPASPSTGNTLDGQVPAAADTAELVDQDGQSLTLQSLRGKTVVIAPFLSLCQETCPMTSANLHAAAAAAQSSGSAGQVVFLEVTVDPTRDTVGRLHAYAKLYGALPDWRLVTGSPQQVLGLWKALGVTTQQTKHVDTVTDWMTGTVIHHSYDVHHQDVVMIIDPTGHLRWVTTGRPDAQGAPLPTSLKSFLNSEGRDNYANPGNGGSSTWTAQDVEQAVAYVQGLASAG
jgi:protein SCO1/2